MYTKEGTIQDRREMLKIKIKSLAVESRIIRAEEHRLRRNSNPAKAVYMRLRAAFRKDKLSPEAMKVAIIGAKQKLDELSLIRPTRPDPLADELYYHRIRVVRKESLQALIVYELIRTGNWIYSWPKNGRSFDWASMENMYYKYGAFPQTVGGREQAKKAFSKIKENHLITV